MILILNLTEHSDEPLHAQLSRQLRAKILATDLDAGAPLPSIRGMAKDQRVSVITVQRAYDDLEREGLIDAWEQPVLPAVLSREHHKSGDRPTDLYRTIATGLNGTPMVGFEGTLESEQIWDLVAYLKSIEGTAPVKAAQAKATPEAASAEGE